MILRKPYAFFIKMFKPIHLFLSILVAYLIYLDNKILVFLNEYMHSITNVVEEKFSAGLNNIFLYIIPIIIICFLIIIFGVMFKKKKPNVFYFVSVFVYLIILVINIYTINFLGILENSVVSIKMTKLIHDLVLITMILSSVSFVFFLVRGFGIDFKRFNFNSDISKINITDSDNEEIEIDIDIDIDEKRRKRKEKFRNLKYLYLENKFFVNIGIIVGVVVITICIILAVVLKNKDNVEGIVYKVSNFNISIDNTIMINTDYEGKKITENYLIVVNARLRSDISNVSLYSKDFSLNIGDVIFKHTDKYSSSLYDLGTSYNQNILSKEFSNYLFIYEVPEKFLDSEMYFSYSNQGNIFKIRLNAKEYSPNSISITKNLKEEISFNDTIGNINFKINNYELKDKFLINYNYCVKENDCVSSIEYLTPSINKNFDKVILRLNVEYSADNKLNVNDFYDFFSQFGTINYKIGDKWYIQNSGFEEISSSKLKEKNISYIGVNEAVLNSDSIKLIFNIRGSKYEYILK